MKTKKFLKKLEASVLDTILPKSCLHCRKEQTFLCSECLDSIKINSFQVCPVCQKSLTEYGEICRYCRSLKPPIDSLTTATSYDNPLIAKSIHLLKYKFIDQLSDPLAKLLLKTYRKNKLAIPDLIIPVPLHPLRLRWRGFNQAELLAQNLAQNLLPNFSIKVNSRILTRLKYTPAQTTLKKSEDRQQNVRDAFQIDSSAINKIKNRRILLVDDICTTGSTLMECGKQLRRLKPKSIQGIVVARQG